MSASRTARRLKLAIRGAVQGVGFRPFIFRLATELDLAGHVRNSPQGVFVEVEGSVPALKQFLVRVERERPAMSFIQSLEPSWLEPVGHSGFAIHPSDTAGVRATMIMPDLATCPDCVRELFDPSDRRHRYAFLNCTNCGPRYSIIESLPYDRANTSMRGFPMCARCRAEYEDPANRRFHAEPIACPDCGPRLELWDAAGQTLAQRDEALRTAAQKVRNGGIVAVKGLGGFHLIVDARNDDAVRQLRKRKQREEKPLALMFPSLEQVKEMCHVSLLEERLLRSPESPIVLLRRNPSAIRHPPSSISHAVAPGNPTLGVMLPYTPLHHLLLADLGFPVVATSGNLSDEPICIDEREALDRLAGIADWFLVHNRPIVRHVDDSVLRVLLDREMVLRRARGYAPLPITVKSATRNPQSAIALAVGAHLKNTIALSIGDQVFLSQHIGDLETAEAFGAFQRVVADLPRLYAAEPSAIAADLHPDYVSTKHGRTLVAPASPSDETGPRHYVEVQHHYAHVLACMAENELEPPVLGVAWDGTGFGTDGTIWGGEFLLVTEREFGRMAHLRPFPLPGGNAAVREPRRSALGLLFAAYGQGAFDQNHLDPMAAFTEAERATLRGMLARQVNCPVTTSVGRLFDAIASLAGLRQVSSFEGQAAMDLEFAAIDCANYDPFPFSLDAGKSGAQVINWLPMLDALLDSLKLGCPVGEIAARFHVTLAEMIVAVARKAGEEKVALTGGCFQNRLLTELAVTRLQDAGFKPFWHQRVPPNDGSIALGQVVAAMRSAL